MKNAKTKATKAAKPFNFDALASAWACHENSATVLINEINLAIKAGVKFGKSKVTCLNRQNLITAFNKAFGKKANGKPVSKSTIDNNISAAVTLISRGKVLPLNGGLPATQAGKKAKQGNKAGNKVSPLDVPFLKVVRSSAKTTKALDPLASAIQIYLGINKFPELKQLADAINQQLITAFPDIEVEIEALADKASAKAKKPKGKSKK